MDFVRPISGDPDLDPVARVKRLQEEREERERREQEEGKRRPPRPQPPAPPEAVVEGPVEGDDGHLHIDVRA